MRFSTVFMILATSAACVNAAPLVHPRQGNGVGCPTTADDGSSLTTVADPPEGADNPGGLKCVYSKAGACEFFADGTFSQGASACPAALIPGGNQKVGAVGGGGAAPPPVQSTSSLGDPVIASPTSTTQVTVAAPTPSSTLVVPPTTSAAPITPTTSSNAAPSSAQSGAPQGNSASGAFQRRPMVLLTFLGIAVGSIMVL